MKHSIAVFSENIIDPVWWFIYWSIVVQNIPCKSLDIFDFFINMKSLPDFRSAKVLKKIHLSLGQFFTLNRALLEIEILQVSGELERWLLKMMITLELVSFQNKWVSEIVNAEFSHSLFEPFKHLRAWFRIVDFHVVKIHPTSSFLILLVEIIWDQIKSVCNLPCTDIRICVVVSCTIGNNEPFEVNMGLRQIHSNFLIMQMDGIGKSWGKDSSVTNSIDI
jgi:hypothetical protein